MTNPHFQYPEVQRNESIHDIFFGKMVPDPYRWLEDPYSDETKQFKIEQNKLTISYLENCSVRHNIREKINELSILSQRSCPIRRGDQYFYSYSTGLPNHRALFVQNSLSQDSIKILDPNNISSDGSVSIRIFNISPNGKIIAFALSKNGSDWMRISFKNLDTNKLYSDILYKVKFTFGIAWTPDSNGIFYQCFPEYQGSTDGTDITKNENQKLYYHQLSTPQSNDILVAEFLQKPNWMIGSIVSDCGNYLIMTIRQGVKDNLVFYASLNSGLQEDLDLKFKSIVNKFEADYTYITNDGPLFYFYTNKGAPNYRIVSIDLEHGWWNTIVPEHNKDVIDWVRSVNGNKLLICYMRNVKHYLQLRQLKNNGIILKEFFIKHEGSISSYFVEKWFNEFFIEIESCVTPGQIYRVNLDDDKPELKIFYPNSPEIIDPKNFITKSIFYTSKDGVKVPMSIIHRTDLVPDKNSPCLLYGYGGYGVSIRPKFSPSNIVFMKNLNGILAFAHVRGGGEYGRNWHNGGRLLKKQNCFDDFQGAAKYLIINQLTCAKKLIIHGMSNGGLLVGSCINQRPDLYGAAIAEVGIMDMLRFNKFTVGSFWCNEFGYPESREHFDNLLRISPLHNIKNQKGIPYPAVLLLASENDDRVVPLHSFKFIAELQHELGQQSQQKDPLMIRIQTKAGHGQGKPKIKMLDEQVDILSFIVQSLGLKFVN